MSSRADYLTKYISDPSKSKSEHRKKKKRPRENNLNIINTGIVDIKESNDIEDVIEPEDKPVEITSGVFREYKGFKRIDNNEIISTEANKTIQPIGETKENIKQGETIYRDLTGRIINIKEKRKQLVEEKKRKEERDKEAKLMNISEITKLEEKKLQEDLNNIKTFSVSKKDEEYNNLMKSKNRFDDPLSSFENQKPTSLNSLSKSGRYEYNKGVSARNRFNVKSGYFWDGIDRSNGFEDLVLQRRQEQMYNKIRDRHTADYDEIDADLE